MVIQYCISFGYKDEMWLVYVQTRVKNWINNLYEYPMKSDCTQCRVCDIQLQMVVGGSDDYHRPK